MRSYFNVLVILIILTSIWSSSSEGRSNKAAGNSSLVFNVTILTRHLGPDAASTVPQDLIAFWDVIQIDGNSLIPNVNCLRVDITPEAEFSITRPEDSVFNRIRKTIGWTPYNERTHLLSKRGEQKIGDKFSVKIKSDKSNNQLRTMLLQYAKDIGEGRIFIYAPQERTNQTDYDLGLHVKGKVFTTSNQLIEKYKEQVGFDIKANHKDLRYLVLFDLGIPQAETKSTPLLRAGNPQGETPPPQPALGDSVLRMVGSNTLGEKLVPLLAKRFMEEEWGAKNVELHSDPSDNEIIYVTGEVQGWKQNITVTARGSGDAFNDRLGLLANPPCDIGMASRPIKDDEKSSLQRTYGQWTAIRGPEPGEGTEHVIAMDGIAIIVHPSNPIKKLTLDTLRRIYSMQITDWSQVNPETAHGKTGSISLFCRARPSGTREFFIEKVKPSSRIDEATQLISSSELAERVARDPQAIGFVSESFIDSGKVKALDISGTAVLENALPCDRKLIRSKEYCLHRPLYLYTSVRPQHEEMVRRFLRFALKEDIQRDVVDESARLISITGTEYELKPKKVIVNKPPPNENIILRVYGSDTIGEDLAIRLAKCFLVEKGARSDDIDESKNTETTRDGTVFVVRVSGHIDGRLRTIEIKPWKSSFGFDSLADGTCDVAMSSDAISPKYMSQLEQEGFIGMDGPNAQFAIGYDALAIIVNPRNPLRNLSLSQVRSIFTGHVTNWSEVGGQNLPITVYSRPEGSGTRQFFTRQVLNEAGITPSAAVKVRNPDMASAVAGNLGGIAYLPFSESQGSTVIAVGDGNDRYEPNLLTVVTRNLYPIKRTLYLYIPPSEARLKDSQRSRYADARSFVLNAQDLNKGQKEVKNAKFFVMIDFNPSNRLLTSVTFDFNRANLDSDSENKINNTLLKFIGQDPAWQRKRFSVKGFSDIIGSDQACEAKAHQRAEIVAALLKQKGLTVTEAKSGGKSNLGGHTLGANRELLREDRRAEIWITQ